jgi:hypothetical protein
LAGAILQRKLALANAPKASQKDHPPQYFVGTVEYHLEPERRDSWDGAFNGKCFSFAPAASRPSSKRIPPVAQRFIFYATTLMERLSIPPKSTLRFFRSCVAESAFEQSGFSCLLNLNFACREKAASFSISMLTGGCYVREEFCLEG